MAHHFWPGELNLLVRLIMDLSHCLNYMIMVRNAIGQVSASTQYKELLYVIPHSISV